MLSSLDYFALTFFSLTVHVAFDRSIFGQEFVGLMGSFVVFSLVHGYDC